MRIIREHEFFFEINLVLREADVKNYSYVTGPGRSGAIAAVYASHILHIPFIPFGQFPKGGEILIIDTAAETGKTIKKALRKYVRYSPIAITIYKEPPRVMFWYEAPKPQFYRKVS